MKIELTEIVNTVPWSEGVSNAPSDVAVKAKQLAEEGKPAIFGKIEGTDAWVVVGANLGNALQVVYRANS
jgi:hypothetical protein